MEKDMRRYGMVTRVRPERLEDYKREHAAVWPEVLDVIRQCHIRNYSIYHKDGWLFSYFEYAGEDFDADMRKMAADPATQRWWSLVGPWLEPPATRVPGKWWANMEEVFHCE